jgi:hypothetical protein
MDSEKWLLQPVANTEMDKATLNRKHHHQLIIINFGFGYSLSKLVGE